MDANVAFIAEPSAGTLDRRLPVTRCTSAMPLFHMLKFGGGGDVTGDGGGGNGDGGGGGGGGGGERTAGGGDAAIGGGGITTGGDVAFFDGVIGGGSRAIGDGNVAIGGGTLTTSGDVRMGGGELSPIHTAIPSQTSTPTWMPSIGSRDRFH